MTPGSRRTDLSPLHILAALIGLAMLIGAAGLVIMPAPPAAAETPGGSIEIVDQTTFVDADGVFSMALDIGTDIDPRHEVIGEGETLDVRVEPPDYELAVTVYSLVDDERSLSLPPSQPLNRVEPVELRSLARTETGSYRLDVAVRSAQPFDDRDRVLLPNHGVYPVTVELRAADEVLAVARTNLVRLPVDDGGDGPPPVVPATALVVPVSAADGLSATEAVDLLVAHPVAPLTLLFQQGVVSRLRADPALAASLVAALAGRPVVATSDPDLDPSALAAIDHDHLYMTAAQATRADLIGMGFTVDQQLVVLDAPLTRRGVDPLVQIGVETVLGTGPGRRESGSVAAAASGAVRLLHVDSTLTSVLVGPDDAVVGPAERVNRLLAAMAVRYRDGDRATVVIGGPTSGLRATAVDAYLRELARPGAPRSVLVTAAEAGSRRPVRAAELPEQNLVPIADRLARVEDKLATYEGFYQAGGTTPGDYRLQLLSVLARNRDPGDRMRALTMLESRVDDELSVIGLPGGQPVTLAARSAPIPLIVQSEAGGPRSVMLRIRSDKVMAVDDGQVIVVAPGTSSIDVEVEALSLGASPLEVSVWTPDGRTNLATTRFEVRSTAVPGVGSLAALAAVGFLIAWWVADARKRRAARLNRVGPPGGPPSDT